jgi:hypothetical protein
MMMKTYFCEDDGILLLCKFPVQIAVVKDDNLVVPKCIAEVHRAMAVQNVDSDIL